MSTQDAPSAVELGSAILLLATGGTLLAGGAGALLYRGQVGTRVGLHGHVVASLGAAFALCGLVALFAGYWVSRRSAR
jgi:hypothetical protein